MRRDGGDADPENRSSGVHNAVSHSSAGLIIQAQHIHGEMRFDVRAVPTPTAQRQIPPRMAGFVGRAEGLSVLSALLAPGARANTVVVSAVAGLAGVGKTALVVEASHAAVAARWFPGGVLFVDLHGYDETPVGAAQALDSLLRALGVPGEHIPAGVEARAALYRSVLFEWNGRVLVVADNASSAGQVWPLLPGDDRHRVLVTSRHTLPQLGARLLNLDVLSISDAVALLDKALRTADPDDTRIGTGLAAAKKVAGLCGRLPLALQIAAALLVRDPEKPVAELAGELASSGGLLTQLDDGERAVKAAFDLSYRRLNPDQAYLFRLLGLHPGADLTAPAAAALADRPEPWAQRMLEDLVTASMVQRAPIRGRWRLHDLIHEYASDLAQAEPALEMRRRVNGVLDYYLHIARAAGQCLMPGADTSNRPFTGRAEALSWLEAERANLSSCVVHAALVQGDQHGAAIAHAVATFLRQSGYWQQAIHLHGLACRIARVAGDRIGEANALNDVGIVQQLTGNYAAAMASHSSAWSLFEELGDQRGQASALNNLGRVQYLSDEGGAGTSHAQALELYRAAGDRLGQADSLNNLGSVQYVSGKYVAAMASHSEALKLYREIDDRFGQADALNNLGRVQCITGDYTAATASHVQAVGLCAELGDRLGRASALNNLGRVQRLVGEYTAAAGNHTEALRLYRELGNRVGQASAHNNIGTVRYLTDDYGNAIANHTQALELYRNLSDWVGMAGALNNLGRVYCVTGDYQASATCHTEALELDERSSDRLGKADALNSLGRVYRLTGNLAAAEQSHTEALRLFQELGHQLGAASALDNLGRRAEAQSIYQDLGITPIDKPVHADE